MSNKKFKKANLLICGRSTVDILMKVDNFSDKPLKQFASDFKFSTGGPAANASIAAARHGAEVKLLTKLGKDFFGNFIFKKLTEEGIKIDRNLINNNARSSVSLALIDNEGERQTINFGGDGFKSINRGMFDKFVPNVILTDNRYPEITRKALSFAHKRNIPSVLDAEAPFIFEDIKYATHIAFSLQGFRDFVPNLTFEKALKLAQKKLNCWICVTDGENGVWVCDKDNYVQQMTAFKIDAVDTVGAGDVWHGIFAMRIAEGETEENAVIFANAAAAIKCQKFGGINACPRREETLNFLSENGC